MIWYRVLKKAESHQEINWEKVQNGPFVSEWPVTAYQIFTSFCKDKILTANYYINKIVDEIIKLRKAIL